MNSIGRWPSAHTDLVQVVDLALLPVEIVRGRAIGGFMIEQGVNTVAVTGNTATDAALDALRQTFRVRCARACPGQVVTRVGPDGACSTALLRSRAQPL